jgi:plasmid maintenance system antidote protein VapI
MKQEYSPHFYESIRIKIACDLIEKECRKLFPTIRNKEIWKRMDRDIENWFNGKKSGLAAVHDFWNGLEGIVRGFKLKDVLTHITSENIIWSLADIPVDKIIFSVDLPITEEIVKAPFDSQTLIDYIANNKKGAEEIRDNSDFYATSSMPRDHYPIMVLEDGKKFQILDGHRRTIRAIIYGNKNICAYLAKFTTRKRVFKNYWVSTGFLRNLTRIWQIAKDNKDYRTAKSITTILQTLSDQHDNVRYILPRRVLNKKPYSDIKIRY